MSFRTIFDYLVGLSSIASMIASFLALRGVSQIKKQINLTNTNKDTKIDGGVKFKASGGNINQAAGDMDINKR